MHNPNAQPNDKIPNNKGNITSGVFPSNIANVIIAVSNAINIPVPQIPKPINIQIISMISQPTTTIIVI